MDLIDVAQWIYGKLDGDAAGVANRVYRNVAPNSATMPYIIFSYIGGEDVLGVGTTRIIGNTRWLVRVVNKTTSGASLETIADSINTLLHGTTGTGVVACYREEAFELTEVLDGEQYQHLGAFYRILAT